MYPPKLTKSCQTSPLADPLPYRTLNALSVSTALVDVEALKVGILLQPVTSVQVEEAIHKSAELCSEEVSSRTERSSGYEPGVENDVHVLRRHSHAYFRKVFSARESSEDQH